MITTTFLLLAACLMLLIVSPPAFRMYRAELALLPAASDIGGFQHPILGVHLPVLLPLPDEVRGRAAIVVMADPACRSCDGEMLELVQARRAEGIPAVCYYEHEGLDPAVVESFVARYAHEVPMIPMRRELVRKLGIDGSPFVFMMDADGMVVRVQRPLKSLVGHFRRVQGSQK